MEVNDKKKLGLDIHLIIAKYLNSGVRTSEI